MKIKNIDFKNDLILAPMAGYTDLGFKLLCEKYGAGATVSEMVSAKALKFESLKTAKLLKSDGLKNVKIAQIFGHEPSVMAEILKNEIFDSYDIIDINMGCPAPKIVKNKDGSSLMKNLDLSFEIISACVKSTDKPISVKFRKGFDENNVNAVVFAKMCESAGASLITVHGRTREQMYSGKSDYEIIKKVKENVKIPVCANGDVVDRESYEKIKNETNADFVMIGRGSLGNPYIFSEILGNKVEKDLLKDIEFHYQTLLNIYSERTVVNAMRKHLAFYLKGRDNSTSLKKEIFQLNTYNKVIKFLEENL